MFNKYVSIARHWWQQDTTSLSVARVMFQERLLFAGLVVSSLVTALTEGLGITMLVPLLGAISSSTTAFNSVPILGRIAGAFSGIPVVARLEIIAVALCVLSISRGLMGYLTVVCAELLCLRVDHKLRRRAVKKVLFLNFEDAQNIGTPVLINYIMAYSGYVAQMSYMLALIIINFAMLLLYIALCILVSWPLTIMAGVMLFIAVQLVKVPLAHRVKRNSESRDTASVMLWQQILAGIGGLKLLRLFGAEVEQEKRIDAALAGYVRADQSVLYLRSLVDPAFQIMVAIIVSTLLFSGTLMYGDGVVDKIPGIVLFLFVLSRMAGPAQTINKARISIVSYINGAQLLFDFLSPNKNPKEPDGSTSISKVEGKLAFKNVTFGYRNSKEPVIDNVSFEIPVGGMTALVGPSGAGKTTLIGLLAGLYRPQTGQILVDDKSLADLKMADWRSRVAFVMQDTTILDDTVSRNLRIGRANATLAQLEDAAERAHAHEFISVLPNGYETLLGERGLQLSGGQAQRIALARALLADPDLLVLDEATSNLDAETEAIIKLMLASFVGKRTIFVAAHRLATVMRADNIIVLEKGRVIEVGKHSELMAAGGLYHRMVNLQMFTDEDQGNSKHEDVVTAADTLPETAS